jgi:hypothetical protein
MEVGRTPFLLAVYLAESVSQAAVPYETCLKIIESLRNAGANTNVRANGTAALHITALLDKSANIKGH